MKTNREIEITLEILKMYKKEHLQHWYDFMKSLMFGYTRTVPEYHEAKVTDFEQWLSEKLDVKSL